MPARYVIKEARYRREFAKFAYFFLLGEFDDFIAWIFFEVEFALLHNFLIINFIQVCNLEVALLLDYRIRITFNSFD